MNRKNKILEGLPNVLTAPKVRGRSKALNLKEGSYPGGVLNADHLTVHSTDNDMIGTKGIAIDTPDQYEMDDNGILNHKTPDNFIGRLPDIDGTRPGVGVLHSSEKNGKPIMHYTLEELEDCVEKATKYDQMIEKYQELEEKAWKYDELSK